MKISKAKLHLVTLIAIGILTILCSFLVAVGSDLTSNIKYSLTFLLLAGEAIVIFVVFNTLSHEKQNLENIPEDTLKDKEVELNQKVTALTQKEAILSERETALKELRSQLEEFKLTIIGNKKNEGAASEVEQLQQKCESLEKFRDGFPYMINSEKNYLLYNVLRTEVSVSSFSRWTLVGEYNGQLWAYSLLRPDVQSYQEMLHLAAGTHEPRELQELDLSKQLLWK